MVDTSQVLKRMIVSTINAREVESARISRLLHDEVGQVLSAVGLQLGVLNLDFRSQVPDLTERIHEIQNILDSAVQKVRALSYDLNPSIVERAGLYSALDRLVGRLRSRFAGTLRLSCDPSLRVPVEVASVWFKLAELALENALQHSRAAKIEVQVRSSAQQFVIEIRDDGEGFSPEEAAQQTPGLGLLLMDHYATQTQVKLEIRSQRGKGTVVRSSWVPPAYGKRVQE